MLEGVPGLGKTMLVRSLGEAVDLDFSRIQFTPDMMPADIQGTSVLVETEGGGHELQFQQGPLVANLVLADEINRATPKTQSALLEAMQEKQISTSNRTIKLEEPYCVMSTQNPVEQEGTYPLPEAQLDRFLFKIVVWATPRSTSTARSSIARPGRRRRTRARCRTPKRSAACARSSARCPCRSTSRTTRSTSSWRRSLGRPSHPRSSTRTSRWARARAGPRRSCSPARCGRCWRGGSR